MIELLLDCIAFISIESIKKSRFVRGIHLKIYYVCCRDSIQFNETLTTEELEPRWWNTREMIFKVGRLTLYFS